MKEESAILFPSLRRYMPVLVAAAIVGAYANSFSGAFVYDDADTFARLRKASQTGNVFIGVLKESPRPLADMTFLLNQSTGGVNPADYHATNLLIHIAAALLLYGIVRRSLLLPVFSGRFEHSAAWLAAISSALWGCHPLTTAGVTYICQRYESMMGMFYFLVLYSAIRGATEETRAGTWYAVAIAAAFCGSMSKEVMITAPLAVLLYDWVFLSQSSVADMMKRRWLLYFGLVLSWPLLVAILANSTPTADNDNGYSMIYLWRGVSPFSYLVTQLHVILLYLKLAVWPVGLCFDYQWTSAGGMQQILVAGSVVGGMTMAVAAGVLKRQRWSFPLAAFFLILAPTSSLIPRPDPIAEYRMYLPLSGLVVAGVMLCHSIMERIAHRGMAYMRWIRASAAVMAIVLIVLLAFMTIARNEVYESEESIWRSVVEKQPDNLRACTGLSAALLSAEKYEEAEQSLKYTLASCPEITDSTSSYIKAVYSLSHNNMGVLKFRQGMFKDAELHFREALKARPGAEDIRMNLANALARQGKPAEQ